MEKIDIYIGVPIGIMSIAYPILLQVIANLDQKYSSERIVGLFEKEPERKWFTRLLVASLICIVFYSFQARPILHGWFWDVILPNSAAELLIAAVILLTIVFFLYVKKILIYSNTSKFISYLTDKHYSARSNLIYFDALGDLLLFSIKKQDKNVSDTISRFAYNVFQKCREESVGKPVEYPDDYYTLVYKSIEELAILEKGRNSALEVRTAGGIWLLGELQPGEISEKTYIWLWRNIVVMTNYERDNMVMYHWSTADQHIAYALRREEQEYDYVTNRISNEVQIKKRDAERKRFLEFHYALGGLLLYKQRYNCLRRIFRYTTSQPPDYPLLPLSMHDIFHWYNDFRNPYDERFDWMTRYYWFPNEEGMNSEGVVKRWIYSYFAVLFLRQYTIIPYMTYMHPLELPHLPSDQAEKREWIAGLDFFKQRIEEVLDNEELIDILGLDFITKQWCEENKKPYPLDFIESLRSALETSYSVGEVNLNIDSEKEKAFLEASKTVLDNTFKIHSSAFVKTLPFESGSTWKIVGTKMLQTKDVFATKPVVGHLDYDSFLGRVVAEDFREQFVRSFLYSKSKVYLLKRSDLLRALEKIGVNPDFVIVSLHANFSEASVNGAEVIKLPGSRFVSNSLFILKKVDLPALEFKDIDKATIDKYKLQQILPEYKVYASVLDLNKEDQGIRDEFKAEANEEELKKSALMSILMATEIKWKKGVKMFQLIEYSEYKQQGQVNDLKEIEVFEDKSK